MHLTQRRFGIEPEIVARLSQMGARVYEVPISYYGRTYAEGKKITWRDGVAALYHILRAAMTAHTQSRLQRHVPPGLV
jgi:TPR repeat protein